MDEQQFREGINTFLPTLKLFVKAFKDKDQGRSFIDYMNNLPKNQIQNFYDEYKNLKREKINRVRITILERLLEGTLTYEDAVNIFEDEKKLWEPRTLKNWTIPRIVYPFCYGEKKHYEKFTEGFLKEVCDYVVDGASYDRNKITNPGSVTFDGANNFGKNGFYVGFGNATHPDYTTQDQFRIESEGDDKLNVGIYHHKKGFIEGKYKKFDLNSVTLKDLVDEAKECKDIVENDIYKGEVQKFKIEGDDSVLPTPSKTMTSVSLNTILYGVPGTGKTYNTVNYAVSAIEGKKLEDVCKEDWMEVKKRYDTYKAGGQIVFTTFHQSFGYEDFIEGIKANIENGNVNYTIESGIFKNLCEKATIGEGFETAYKNLIKDISEMEEPFKLKTKNGNIFGILVNSKNNLSLFTGENLNPNGTITKDNLQKWLNGDTDFVIGWESYYRGIIDYLKTKYNLNTNAVNKKNYVLIIDEINRGNISKIFGELITLIEPQKRLGMPEQIKVRLPYSQDEFGVPSNLFILGTMNTADRSIALMDLALRRRFSFNEIEPDSSLLDGIIIDGINIRELFETYNKRIEFLYDRDHLLGHAYFLPLKKEATLEKLNHIVLDKVIPLLQEYFHDDWEKIQLVLGKGLIHSEEVVASNILGVDNTDYEDQTKYSINLNPSAEDYNI